jgi:tRNA threonylcarbamoyladenosine biosynthesis protein TsaB
MAGVAPAGTMGGEDMEGRGKRRLTRRAGLCRSVTSQAEASGGSLRILAIDTTTRAGSTAVLDDLQVLIELTGDEAATHGERLPADLARTLSMAGAALESIDLLAVVAGPGSFTGLRVGIASMQGLAFARGLKIVPVSALEAIARQAHRGLAPSRVIAPWVDAHRGEVFAALYSGSPLGEIVQPTAASPEQTLRSYEGLDVSGPIVFAGDGAVRYRTAIVTALGDRAEAQASAAPLAAEAGRIAAAHPERAVAPDAVVPIYVRRPDAELARERARTR